MSNLALLAFIAIQDELKKDVMLLNSQDSLVKNILISGDELCGINYDKKDNLILFTNKITKEGMTRVFFENPELGCQEKYIYQHKNICLALSTPRDVLRSAIQEPSRGNLVYSNESQFHSKVSRKTIF